MDKKSKVISGFRTAGSFDIEERHKIIQEMLSSNCTRAEIWRKHSGQNQEHGILIRWMNQLGYDTGNIKRRITFGRNNNFVSNKKKPLQVEDESFEILQLNKRVLELESQLKDAEMKAIAFSTMVDIAEKEFNIPIRKKLNTKPLKK